MRKFLFILCINILKIDLERQCLVLILILYSFLNLQIKKKPYKESKLNALDKFSQISLIVTLVLSLLSFSLDIEEFQIMINIFILGLNLFFIGWIIFYIFILNYGRIKHIIIGLSQVKSKESLKKFFSSKKKVPKARINLK